MYFCINHFFNKQEADNAFEKLTQDYVFLERKKKGFLRYASNDRFWIALKKTMDTITLIADLMVIPTNLSVFTTIEYEYAEPYSFEVIEILPKNKFKLRFREDEEEGYLGLFYEIIDFSNFTFLIQTFYNRSDEAFKKIIEKEHKISFDYEWKIPKNFGEEFLTDLENSLDLCGRYYSKIEVNFYLALTHLKNIKKIKIDIDINTIQRIIDEMRLKLMSSKVIYERIKDMKDIAMGNVEIRNMNSNIQLQKELLGLQKFSITIQHASIVIEAFIIFAYTFTVWKWTEPHFVYNQLRNFTI